MSPAKVSSAGVGAVPPASSWEIPGRTRMGQVLKQGGAIVRLSRGFKSSDYTHKVVRGAGCPHGIEVMC